MLNLVRLQHFLLAGSILLLLLYLCLCIGVAPSRETWQVILPRWTVHIANAGLVLLVLSRLLAVATRRGWRRLNPVLALALYVPVLVLVVLLVSADTKRVEIDRVTLPGGRVVMMTLEPVLTDTVFGLWEQPNGWRWRSLFEGARDITYSEDRSFTEDPRLVVTMDGRYLLIRRGGIWTDCWAIETTLTPCLQGLNTASEKQDDWRGRSEQIAAVVGSGPSGP